jgi:molybdenum cofactor biosynthesis enzyme MoaA
MKEQLDSAARVLDAKAFKKALEEIFDSSPPKLLHHGVDKDVYFIVQEWIQTTKFSFSAEHLFAEIRPWSEAQFLTLVGYSHQLRGNTKLAIKLYVEAISHDCDYAPANNQLAGLEKPDCHSDLDQYLCALPFSEMQLKTINGIDQFTFCCLQWSPYLMGDMKGKTSDEIWNSEGAKEFRRSIVDGDYKYCNRRLCSVINNKAHHMISVKGMNKLDDRPDTGAGLQKGSAAKRLHENSIFMKEQLQKDAPLVVDRPRHIFIAYDESCNLACPSCRKEIKQPDQGELSRMDDIFELAVRPLLKKGEVLLTASGRGDPLGSPHLRSKLQTLCGDEYRNLKLNLQTNGLLFNHNGWKHIKAIEDKIEDIRVSVDAATKETYEILRFPGQWCEVMESLEYLSKKKNNLGFRLVINLCIQKINYKEIPMFVEMGRRLDVDLVNLQQLINWGTYAKADYAERNVVSTEHPEHAEFISILKAAYRSWDRIQLASGLPRLIA